MTTPKLRFKGFDQIWNSVILDDVVNFKNGKAHEQDIVENGEFILINSKFISTEGMVRKYTNKKNCEISPGHIAMVMSDVPNGKALAKCYYVNGKNYSLNQRICSLSPKKDHSKFLFYQINRNRYFLSFDSGVGQTNLRKDEVLECPIILPSSYEEQQKISDFLTSVDEKINLLKKKKELLEQYKKGVMQKIFSQELRFKDDEGKEFPEWEEKILSEVFVKSNVKNKGSLIKSVLTNSAVNGVMLQSDYFDRDIANQNNLQGYYIVEIDDFVYNPRISESAPVGPLKRNRTTKGVMSPLYTILTPLEGNLDYFEHYFNSPYWHQYMKDNSNAGARHDRMNISNKVMLELPLPYPDLKEQQKIADFLSALDDKIALVEQQINKTELWKKGLLQQMFV